ncbi:hypothetical protein SEA_EVAA_21 [Gordonia phage Evaa]|nr:hypothetical protein SEA_EVAA_21 [Gordonia phage Evaa]
MTTAEPIISDPVSDIITVFVAAMREAFTPDSEFPPIGGGSTDVRVFAGDGIPIETWNAHADNGCDNPFLWVRLVRRYRTENFPSPSTSPSNCSLPRAAAIEVGVGRCAVVGLEPSWEDYANEAEVSIDDSWRIELALCRALAKAREQHLAHAGASDLIAPYGPDGGIVAYLGMGYVQF